VSGYILIEINVDGDVFLEQFRDKAAVLAWLNTEVRDDQIRGSLPKDAEYGTPEAAGLYLIRGELVVPQRTNWRVP
jgi:hypothetical protein